MTLILCRTCHRELEPDDVHSDHEEGCLGLPCSCDRPSCASCCATCDAERRYGMLLEVLVVFVLTAWSITAALAVGRVR